MGQTPYDSTLKWNLKKKKEKEKKKHTKSRIRPITTENKLMVGRGKGMEGWGGGRENLK